MPWDDNGKGQQERVRRDGGTLLGKLGMVVEQGALGMISGSSSRKKVRTVWCPSWQKGPKKKNDPSPNFCLGLRIDPINMFQVFLGSFSRRKKFGPSETPNSLKFTRKISFFDFKLLKNT